MPYLCLLLSGAALLVNGLALLGRLPRRDAGTLSLVVGIIQLGLAVGYVTTHDGGTPVMLSAAGMLLFGLTYTYVGLDTFLALGGKGLGWFCGMVALFGMLLAAAWLGSDPVLAVLWLAWAALWGLFFVSLALGRSAVDPFTGWALVLTSQVTATVPAFLGLAGLWPSAPEAAPGMAFGAAAVLALLFTTAAVLARPGIRFRVRPASGSAATSLQRQGT
ncbi:AmiS/UreI family transporter [Pseudarthrobacter sp. J75]|uniref:AmiS/UreI family transporter n=1 Tax=unclassified Pseudarthrobacter TaxID=2647000 RepID=UPI002E81426E|nr:MULTISPECIES: AmiS/UreI family transporter [unclassified Pseudarthrobacter]MEE2524131.1 AmiS/UreI family transporter [Pseudarthrobacter sp. J47]MEE2530410.1 AmiS/UreI family transporter [Pseudarthrobacter sp. J75]